MRILVRTGTVLLAAGLIAGPSAMASAVEVTPPPAAAAAADAGAEWLAGQLTANGGFITGFTGQSSLGDTADAVLALHAAGVGAAAAAQALAWLQDNYSDAGANPGSLAQLILVADAAGVDPTDFAGEAGDGDDLVAALLATMQTTGPNSGLFGSADPTFDGAFRQGLSLIALGAAGVGTADVQAAVDWLELQQCENGAWTAYRADPTVACPATDPASFSGPDTNSTAVAASGLLSIGANAAADALLWLIANQDDDGGWAYYPGPTSVSDPNSTALSMSALVAGGQTPAGRAYERLLDFALTTGPDAGAFWFDLGDGTQKANALATSQAVPAAAGRSLPLGASPIPASEGTPTPSQTPTATASPSPTPTSMASPSPAQANPSPSTTVIGIAVTNPDLTSGGSQLADTGSTATLPLVGAALGAVVIGAGLIALSRRGSKPDSR